MQFIADPNTTLSRVLMRVRSGVTNYYVYGLGLLYEVTETATNSYQRYYHYDYRGSTVALTDGNGNVTDRIEYSAYGTTTYRTGTTDTPFLFNGRYGVQTDPNGLLYMRARYYNPYICRFINPDPIGFAGGLNWYAYADGNPVSYLDPFGLCAVGESSSWLNTAWNVTKGVGLMGAGLVPWLGDLIEAYTVVAPGSSGLDRALSGASLGVSAWTLGAAPNLGPIKRGAQMIGDAFTGAAKGTPITNPSRLLPERAGPIAHISPNEVIGQTPAQINARAQQLGLQPRGPDPAMGRGAYIDPQTGVQRILCHPDATHRTPT